MACVLHNTVGMSKNRSWTFAMTLALVVGCGGAPKPEARLSSDEGAIRGAKEAGAASVPTATLQLQLAQEERQKAVELIRHGDNHRAEMLLARSEADAELAIALAREANATAQAQQAQAEASDLEQKARQ